MQPQQPVAAEPFEHWILSVRQDRSACFVCDDGNRNSIYEMDIDFTTFPLDEIRLYVIDNVILLPSEY